MSTCVYLCTKLAIPNNGTCRRYGAGASYKFSCSKNQGAIVVLGDHGTRSIVRKNKAFEKYMESHQDSWYQFALSLDHDIDRDDLVLVSGWVKTSQWALAACTNYGRAHEVTLDASVAGVASAKFEIKLCQDVEMSVDQRSGPSRRTKLDRQSLPRDQCLFLRYYKAKRRLPFGPKKIVAGSGPKKCYSYDESSRHARPGVLANEHHFHTTSRHNSHDCAFDIREDALNEGVDEISIGGRIQEEPLTISYVSRLFANDPN